MCLSTSRKTRLQEIVQSQHDFITKRSMKAGLQNMDDTSGERVTLKCPAHSASREQELSFYPPDSVLQDADCPAQLPPELGPDQDSWDSRNYYCY